jgi:hypothetical protein
MARKKSMSAGQAKGAAMQREDDLATSTGPVDAAALQWWDPSHKKAIRSGTYFFSDEPIADSTSHSGQAFRTASAGRAGGAAGLALSLPRRFVWEREEVRLDVDRLYPQMAISGTRSGGFAVACHWAAQLTQTGPFTYEGPTFYFDPPDAQLFNYVCAIVDNMSSSTVHQTLTVIFSSSMGSQYDYGRDYSFQSPHFHKVEFEYDYVANAVPVTAFDTDLHPQRPADLASEVLDIGTVFGRAGFDVTLSGGDSAIPLSDAGSDALWTNQELHDAMQLYWSRYATKSQWSLWVLFAGLHHDSNQMGGIMFDDVGPNQRQGAAIFLNSATNNPPSLDPNQSEWRDRMRFWTAIHEMGHAFNLAHSFQKTGGIHMGPSWINMQDEPNARSFMNYPASISGGLGSYFSSFYYRFSDQELLFLRHAPSRFVQMGNEVFFTNHGYLAAAESNHSDFELTLSVTAPGGRFHYLVPPVVEMEIAYHGSRPAIVSGSGLASQPGLAMIIAPEGRPATRWLPYVRHCREGDHRVLHSGDVIHDSIMVGAGRNGWSMAQPGRYRVQAVLAIGGQTVFSNQLMITVEAPASRAEERLSVDIFTPEVGQVLGVNGSRGVEAVNDVLARALELRDNPISKLAAMALATPLSYAFKQLEFEHGEPLSSGQRPGGTGAGKRFQTYRADPAAARRLIAAAVVEGGGDVLINAIGHARFLREVPLLGPALDPNRSGADCGEDPEIGIAARLLSASPALSKTIDRKRVTIAR